MQRAVGCYGWDTAGPRLSCQRDVGSHSPRSSGQPWQQRQEAPTTTNVNNLEKCNWRRRFVQSLHVQENLTLARCRPCLLNSDRWWSQIPWTPISSLDPQHRGCAKVPDEFTHHAVANGAPMELCHDCFRLATFLSRCGSMHDHFEVILV